MRTKNLKQKIADDLGTLQVLADTLVIPHNGRTIEGKLREGLQKNKGLAVVVDVVGATAKDQDKPSHALTLFTDISVTIWVIPTLLNHESTDPLITDGGDRIIEDDGDRMGSEIDPVAPLTEGERNPDDILDDIVDFLHNRIPGGEAKGCPGFSSMWVTGWRPMPAEPPFLVHEVTARTKRITTN